MGESTSLVIGDSNHEHALIFAATSTLPQVFVPISPLRSGAQIHDADAVCLREQRRSPSNIPWSAALLAAVWPKPTINADYFLMVVAVLGTTISPYQFANGLLAGSRGNASGQERSSRLRELSRAAIPGDRAHQDRLTTVGMIFSGSVAFFIILTTAAVSECPRRHQTSPPRPRRPRR